MPISAAELLSAAYSDADRTIDLRRRLHRHPEIGLQLPQTQAMVLEAFADLPVELTTGTTTSSVVGVLRGARPGPTYLLRGDMDGLPVQEDTGLPFASEETGAMHACGHDTHVAMLLGDTRLLAASRALLPGRMMAAADQWKIAVRGRGGHASEPHAAAYRIPVAAEIVLALQTMVTRSV